MSIVSKKVVLAFQTTFSDNRVEYEFISDNTAYLRPTVEVERVEPERVEVSVVSSVDELFDEELVEIPKKHKESKSPSVKENKDENKDNKEKTKKKTTTKKEKTPSIKKSVEPKDKFVYEIDFKFKPVFKSIISNKTITAEAIEELNKYGVFMVKKILKKSNNDLSLIKKSLKKMVDNEDLYKHAKTEIGKKLSLFEEKKDKSLAKRCGFQMSLTGLTKYLKEQDIDIKRRKLL